ncbi:MAG TPA: hypothetical protein VF857_06385, partial [Spirochaetota bacterium]
MRKKTFFFAYPVLVVLIFAFGLTRSVTQEKMTLHAPNGISFSEITGYENYRIVAPSYRTELNELR